MLAPSALSSRHEPSRHGEAGAVEPDHVAHFLDEPGEHRA
jgi:hypothetical protein